MNKHLSLVTAPAVEPISLTEAKTHLRVDSTADDAYITSLIIVAREAAELYTQRTFITQTWQMFMDCWPIGKGRDDWFSGVRQMPITSITGSSSIELPKPPLQSVTHIKTYANDDTATTYSSANYYVSTYSGLNPSNGRITLRDGDGWPSPSRNADGIEIHFISGYGDASSDVPQQIIQGILEEIAFRYEHRGDLLDVNTINSQMAVGLLATFRLFNV
tara:strand:+ start:5161 stop:5814 length:654 start_codon:yes stop_codon:yes gene_type:complete